jgi:hypothetical protein
MCVHVCVCVCVLEHIKIPCRNVRNVSYDLPSYFRIHTSLTTSRVYWTVGISSFQISANLQWSCAERNTNGRQVILKSTSVIRNRFLATRTRLLRCVSCSILSFSIFLHFVIPVPLSAQHVHFSSVVACLKFSKDCYEMWYCEQYTLVSFFIFSIPRITIQLLQFKPTGAQSYSWIGRFVFAYWALTNFTFSILCLTAEL